MMSSKKTNKNSKIQSILSAKSSVKKKNSIQNKKLKASALKEIISYDLPNKLISEPSKIIKEEYVSLPIVVLPSPINSTLQTRPSTTFQDLDKYWEDSANLFVIKQKETCSKIVQEINNEKYTQLTSEDLYKVLTKLKLGFITWQVTHKPIEVIDENTSH